VVLHSLPEDAPGLNPVGRVWWVLHGQVTRNRPCQTLQELVALVMAWLDGRQGFGVADGEYHLDEQPSHAA
jgi:hypothetical protein